MRLEDTLYGPLSAPDRQDDLIIRALQTLGEWGAVEVALVAAMMKPDEVLYDVGAFLGTFGLGIARQVPLRHLVAVEPNPLLVPHLTENLTRNLACRFEVVSTAVGLQNGVLGVAGDDTSNLGAHHFTATVEPDAPVVESRSLRSLRDTHGDYSVLKLDVEGLEYDVLRSDYKYLTTVKPLLWVECNEDARSFDILQAMKSIGYEPLYVAFPAFRTANFRNSSDLIYPMAYEAALLGAPRERLSRLPSSVDGEIILARPVANRFELRRALFDTPRWSRAEWLSMNRAELIARLGRLQRGETLDKFLME